MRRVALNAAWNVGGQVVSLGVGLVALPLLLRALGTDRLGVFTLALGLIGLSGLLDLGLGRALTQTVSTRLAEGRPRAQLAALVWRVIGLLAAVGAVFLAVLWWAAPFLANRLFLLPPEMARETVFGLRALALSIPFALAATAAIGTLEGLQQFRLLSLWRMVMSVLQFGLPVGVALLRPDVGWVIAALAATRVVWLLVWITQLQRFLPRQRGVRPPRSDLHHALRFSGWLSVSNLIGPLMLYADRFYLASQFPPATVAYYTVPFDTTFRATSLPQTAMNALFPALAEARNRPDDSGRMVALAARVLTVLAFPPVLLVAIFAHHLLAWWLDPGFAGPATPVLQLLLIGIYVNSLAHVPYALLQAHGRSDVTAKLHVAELPLFAIMLVLSVHFLGITGAALAWTMRVALDTGLLYGLAWWLHPAQRRVLLQAAGWVALNGVLLALTVFALPEDIQAPLAVIVAVLGAVRGLHLLRFLRPASRREPFP